jgi:hypothetical protein
MKKYILPFVIAFSALAISSSSGLYSIIGLSRLFAGASTAVLIMASALELAKLVTASFLYQYWDKVNKWLKIYLTIATIILILITSAGIYGYLSSAYSVTSSKNIVVENQIKALETKKERYLEARDIYIKDKTQITQSTSELRKALSTGTITQYKDKETGQIINIANSSNRKAYEKQLVNTSKEEEKLTSKIDILNDSVFSLESQILDTKSKEETSGELGPLKYLSNLTNQPMDKIINWFILVIILVFDPLAISLVIAANFTFNQIRKSEKLVIYNEKPIEPEKSKPIPPPIPKSKSSWYNYVPPIFKRKKEDDEIKTY